jgi:hypothetical protein
MQDILSNCHGLTEERFEAGTVMIAGPEGWSSRDKFATVVETVAMNEADLSEYCRQRGLFFEQIRALAERRAGGACVLPGQAATSST